MCGASVRVSDMDEVLSTVVKQEFKTGIWA